jgi:hypothetical protein
MPFGSQKAQKHAQRCSAPLRRPPPALSLPQNELPQATCIQLPRIFTDLI